MNINQPEPPPQNDPSGKPVWESVIREIRTTRGQEPLVALLLLDMAERDQMGQAKYGVPLVAENGRDHLKDAYQEELDRVVYYYAEVVSGDPSGVAAIGYREAVNAALRVRGALEKRLRIRLAVAKELTFYAGRPLTWEECARATFQSLNVDSLDLIVVVMNLEEMFQVDLDDESELCYRTPIELAKEVERAVGAKPT